MEKVIVINGYMDLSQSDVSEVEKFLNQGWNVKSVTMEHCDDRISAIFVLQKDAV